VGVGEALLEAGTFNWFHNSTSVLSLFGGGGGDIRWADDGDTGTEVAGVVEPLALVADAEGVDGACICPATEGSGRDAIVLGDLGAGHEGVDTLLEEPAVLGSDVGAVPRSPEPRP